MADIAIFRINYKSDFILTLNSDAGWLTPFCIKFWTGAPSQAYYAYYDGMSYTHCAPVEGEPTKLLVQFDDHHLTIGDLKFQIGYHFTVDDFPTTVEDEVINQASVIIEVDDAPAQVMLDLNGETAPEIEFSLPAYANEAQRIANEEQRIAAEAIRIVNEESRIAAETIRQQNEAQRISNEESRVADFAQMKQESETATADANTAATLANEKAQLAADKAALADYAATLANAKAQLAADKAALADDAATLANAKAQLAADKAALADAAATLANDKAALAQQKAEYAQTQGDYAKAQGNYAKEQGEIAEEDHERAEADHTRAESDHTQATSDHTQADTDHTRAESDHATASADHTQAGQDHTRAESDHTQATSDHTQSGTDHTRAESDHATASADHTQAGQDHTRAESDHTRAESDHAAVEVYVDSLGAFDISAYHATGGVLAKYADLTAALGTNGANIPEAIRKGGMSVKFVLSSDNKYVQYRLVAPNWSTNIHDWTSEDPYFIDKIMQEVNEAIDENTPIEITGDVTNAPDEEDLTSVNVGGTDVLKFKDKAYTPLTYSGMGRKILRKNIVNGVNILTQGMMPVAETAGEEDPGRNTIYVIQYDYDLNGQTIKVPSNCVLEFCGGSLNNGSLVLSSTLMKGNVKNCCITTGSVANEYAVPEWYGAVGDGQTNDTVAIQNCIDGNDNVKFIYNKTYLLAGEVQTLRGNKHYIHLHSNMKIDFGKSTIKRISKETVESTVSMIYLGDISNVYVSNGIIIGDLAAHTDLPMDVEYWSHGIAMRGCENIKIDGINSQYHMGDGITCMYGSASNHIIIENCDVKKCQRHDISFTRGEDYLIRNCNLGYVYWMDAIDVEQHVVNEPISNVTIDGIVTTDNGIECIGVNNFILANSIINSNVYLGNKNREDINTVAEIHNCVIKNDVRVEDKGIVYNSSIKRVRVKSTANYIKLNNGSIKDFIVISGGTPTASIICNDCNINIENAVNLGSVSMNMLEFNNCSFDIKADVDFSKAIDVQCNNCVIKSHIISPALKGFNSTSMYSCTYIQYDTENNNSSFVFLNSKTNLHVDGCIFDFRNVQNGLDYDYPITLRSKSVVFNNNIVIADTLLGNGYLIRANYNNNESVEGINNIARLFTTLFQVTTAEVEVVNNILKNSFPIPPTKGTTANRPVGVHQEGDVFVGTLVSSRDIGFAYFDTNLHKIIYVDAINSSTGVVTWVDALGNPIDSVYPKVIGTPTAGNLAKFNSTNVHDIEDAGITPQV